MAWITFDSVDGHKYQLLDTAIQALITRPEAPLNPAVLVSSIFIIVDLANYKLIQDALAPMVSKLPIDNPNTFDSSNFS